MDIFNCDSGAVDVKTVTGAKAKNYLRHPSCTKHEKSFTTLHDYGLIVLRKPLAGKEISYAPVYTIATLAELWTRSMAESSVCLNLGFGEYLLSEKGPLPETAPALMHGWVRMMDWLGCYEQSSPKGLVGNWNYTNEATWFCTKRLPSKQQNQGKGDSGSPVTCNNQYTGIIAATWTYEKPFRYLFSTSMSTAFSVLENSAEYRKGLILSVALYEFDSKIKVFFYRPTTEPIRMYRSVFSNCQSPSATLCTFLVWVSLSALYVAYENIFLKCL